MLSSLTFIRLINSWPFFLPVNLTTANVNPFVNHNITKFIALAIVTNPKVIGFVELSKVGNFVVSRKSCQKLKYTNGCMTKCPNRISHII